MPQMMSAADLLDKWLGDIEDTSTKVRDAMGEAGLFNGHYLYPFFVRVGCVKMAAPRHERFEFLLGMGEGEIDNVFNGLRFYNEHLTFVFPERYMSVHEQQAFMSTLTNHPFVDMITRMDMITSSPLLIGNFINRSIRTLQWDDDYKHDGKGEWERENER
jgi:hypothetical protein